MVPNSPSIAAIGEVMVEMSPAPGSDGGCYSLGFAGDTFNTVVALARLDLATAYVTLLGDDAFSDQILALMTGENIATNLVTRLPGRQPGMYLIANSADGERTFSYWRGEAPARELWANTEVLTALETSLSNYSCIYLSGITLAIMRPQARDRLYGFLTNYRRHGGQVGFDSNYRPRLWPSAQDAASVIGQFLPLADIALLTIEDEQALWGKLSAEQLIQQHSNSGLTEIVIKQGAEPVVIGAGSEIIRIAIPVVENIVDTTGAGDGFNAGYLAARLQGDCPKEAVLKGANIAAETLGVRGGIAPKN